MSVSWLFCFKGLIVDGIIVSKKFEICVDEFLPEVIR